MHLLSRNQPSTLPPVGRKLAGGSHVGAAILMAAFVLLASGCAWHSKAKPAQKSALATPAAPLLPPPPPAGASLPPLSASAVPPKAPADVQGLAAATRILSSSAGRKVASLPAKAFSETKSAGRSATKIGKRVAVSGREGLTKAGKSLKRGGEELTKASKSIKHVTQVSLSKGLNESKVRFASFRVWALPGFSNRCGMCWPVSGRVTQPFNEVGGDVHHGIDICAPEGSPVIAACGGTVVYAGSGFSGFGNMIIIDNGNGVSAIYAHNRCNLVHPGQSIRSGQVIAEVGQTGRASAPHCHFELRRGSQPIDPMPFLFSHGTDQNGLPSQHSLQTAQLGSPLKTNSDRNVKVPSAL